MSKDLRVVPANDVVSALLGMADVFAGKCALFIAPSVIGNSKPVVDSLPSEVEDQIALVVESSGSTGSPKRISISLAALLHAARAGQERLGKPGQWLLALPINFIAGQQVLVRSLLADTQPVIMNTTVPFTAEAFFRSALLMTNEVKYTSLVPLQLRRVLEQAKSDAVALRQLQSFRAILVGGQSVPSELLEIAEQLGLRVVVSYGMTETAGGCIYDGIPLDGVLLKISPDGRLQVSGPTLAEDLGDWYTSNDLAELAGGKVKILGRADRVIISGALKISLDLVEELAAKVLGVEEIVAVAIENQEFGERVGLVYQGSPEVADDIANSLVELLGPAGKPVRIIRVDRLPKLATGKVDLLSVAKLLEERN